MLSKQFHFTNENQLKSSFAELKNFSPNLIIAMGGKAWFENKEVLALKKEIPNAVIIGCSTAGEISENGVYEDTLVVNAAQFNNPKMEVASVVVSSMAQSFTSGQKLAEKFDASRVSAVFLLGRGLDINGTKLVEGMQAILGNDVSITGGLAGDGGDFAKTYTLLNGDVMSDSVVALAVYDHSFEIFSGSQGGWQPFGPTRKVTKAKENVLWEIDGRPALDIYKEYLGDMASGLPATGLLFPLELLENENQASGLIRTILDVNETDGSITFAGEVPEGVLVRLMHAKNEGLVAGAKSAAQDCIGNAGGQGAGSFAVLISCVGRKLVMSEDVDDEVDAVKETLGVDNVIGFYSYGEICPHTRDKVSRLHNQTMTISYFRESA